MGEIQFFPSVWWLLWYYNHCLLSKMSASNRNNTKNKQKKFSSVSFKITLREVRPFKWCHFSSGWGRRQPSGTGSWIIKKYIMWEGWRRGSSSVLTSVPVTLVCPNEAVAPHNIHPWPRYGRFVFCSKHSFVKTRSLTGVKCYFKWH